MGFRVSHSGVWDEVSFSFVTDFVAKISDSSSLAPRFEGFPVPALPNESTNCDRRLLLSVWMVRYYLDRSAHFVCIVGG